MPGDRRRGRALIVREAGGVIGVPGLVDPLHAPLDLVPHAPLVAARSAATRDELVQSWAGLRGGGDVIDWYVAERIAWQVAGHGDAPAPLVDLSELAAESERRVVAYTGLTPAQALPEPEGVSRREWVASNIRSMRALIDPVLLRATGRLGPLAPGVQFGLGLAMSVEVGVLVGYLGQRVLGQYELVLLDESPELHPPRLLFVLPNLGHAVRTMHADEREFMIWVALTR